MLIVERGYRGMDTVCKSVTFAAEIGIWLDSHRFVQEPKSSLWVMKNKGLASTSFDGLVLLSLKEDEMMKV